MSRSFAPPPSLIFSKRKNKEFSENNKILLLSVLKRRAANSALRTIDCSFCKQRVSIDSHSIVCECGAIICPRCSLQKIREKKLTVVRDHFLDCYDCEHCRI
jgi:hypothetical protein